MMIINDATIMANGDRVSRREIDPQTLVPEAITLLAGMLRGGGDRFRGPIPHDGASHLQLLWTQAGTGAALATIDGPGKRPLVTSALVSGIDPEADRHVLRELQRAIVRVLRSSQTEPGFDLLGIRDRPLLASVPWPGPQADPLDRMIAADLTTCLAAAFFNPLNLEQT